MFEFGEQPDRRRWRSQGSRASGRGRQMPRSAVDAGRCRAPQQDTGTIIPTLI
jgi:hypothetical protein